MTVHIPWKSRLVGVFEAKTDDYKATVYPANAGYAWWFKPKENVLASLSTNGIESTEANAKQAAEKACDRIYGDEAKRLRDKAKGKRGD